MLDEPSVERVVAEADTGTGIAGLAYCIGSIDIKPLKSTTREDFVRAFTLDVVGAAHAVRVASPALKKASGAVVLFSTVAVVQGFANHAVISAAKAGVEGLMRSLAAELAPEIRVNAVAPSLTRTPLSAKLTANLQMADSIAALHAVPRLGEPEDAAAAAEFLLRGDSSWITGQVLHVDGGRSSLRTKG